MKQSVKFSNIVYSSIVLMGSFAAISFAHADDYVSLGYKLHQKSTSPAPQGAAYATYLTEHNAKDSSDPWLHYEDNTCSDQRNEPTKKHALSLFQEFFMPEVAKTQVGYVDTENQLREFSITKSDGAEVPVSDVLSLDSNNVVIIPVSWDSSTTKMQVYVHYHNEPKEPWGFDQDFSSFPGGRVEKGVHVLSAALNEFYEEMGFQILPSDMDLLGYRHLGDKKITYVYIAVPQGAFHTIGINGHLPAVAQFAPFDKSFVPTDKEAEYQSAIAGVRTSLPAGSKDLAEAEKKVTKRFRVKGLFPRQRGDYDSNGVWGADFLPSVSAGQVFLNVNVDGMLDSVVTGKIDKVAKDILEGRFGSYKNKETFADLTSIYQVFLGSSARL